MLLILCPDILLDAVQNTKSGGTKAKFLEGLKKGIKSSKLADVSVRCYVDFCKAATFVTKSDISALRYIPPTVDIELNDKLFNQQQPFKRSDGTVDEELMVECLKSFFYLSPRKIVNSLFSECVEKNSTPLFKRVLVDTLLEISNEPKRLDWNPTLGDIYSVHASGIRQMFEDFLVSVRDYNNVKNQTDKKGKLQFDKITSDISILIKLIKLYKSDAELALYLKEDKQSEEVRRLLTGLSDCSIFFDIPELSHAATETLIEMFKAENIKRWYCGSDDFWSTTSSVNLILASIVIERSDLDSKTISQSLSILENILTLRNQYINIQNDIVPTPASKHIRLFASTNLESAFLIHLGNSDTQIVSKCLNICRLLCYEVSTLRNKIDESDNSIFANYEAYTQLTELSLLSTGRQAQQKAIRTILKKVDRRTPGNFVAWDEVCYRWNIYTNVVKANEEAALKKDDPNLSKKKKSTTSILDHADSGLQKILQDTKSNGDVLSEWTNYLGVLCSLNGVTINQGSGRAIGARATKIEMSNSPEEFLNSIMDLLVTESLSIRETVKMMLGNAISPSVFTFLFKTLQTQAKKRIFSSDQADFSPTSILFADQCISIVKLILETENDAENLSLLSGFEDLILLLIRFVRQLTINVNNLKIRHRLCGLLQSMMAKNNLLNFRNAFEFRMQLVENIMEWTSEFSTKESNIPTDLSGSETKQVAKLIKELDVQVMQAISSLLKSLPLQGKDDDAKAQGFSNFFSFFTKLLTRCKKSPQTVLTPQLPEATIESLSFLVTANIEHGIEYFLSMGYYEDYESRSAFLRVLTNILKEGTDFDNAESGDKYYKLLEVILSDLDVALTLGDVTPITEADKVAQLLIRIFEANDKSLDLLRQSIRSEVDKTEKENTLFRLNSMATKLLSAYCKVIGKDYLHVSVGPQIKKLIQNPKPMELDPKKMAEGEDVNENQKNVIEICKKFLTDIQLSISSCPLPIREICKFLKDEVTKKFPSAGNTAIAGFIFLRYLCPAIVAPDGFEVIDSPIQDKNIRRYLVIITKTLQNLANRVIFTKETFMQPINHFIEENIPFIEKMFNEFTMINEDEKTQQVNSTIEFSEEQKEEDLGRLHFYLSNSIDKLGKVWADKSSTPYDRVTTLLAQLGPPPELPKDSKNITGGKLFSGTKGAKANAQYEKFMTRMANQNTQSIKDRNIFFAQGKTDKNIPVLYFIPRNWSSNLEMDLFNYYVLTTIQPFLEKPFSIVVDLTFFSAENQIPLSWCTSLYSIIPNGAGQNLDAVYFLHANQWFKKYSKRIGKLVARISKRFIFCTSLSQLCKFIPEESLGLPADTISIEKTIQSTFSKVTMTTKTAQYKKNEVKLTMSTDVLQIYVVKQIPVLNQNVNLVDIIPVSRITNITMPPKEKHEFMLTYNISGPKTNSFSSSSSDQIIQQLTALKDRQGLSKSYARTKTFQPSNVPGTLLNMALLNLTVRNYPLRVAAYNLLVTLCNSFAFNMESKLFEAYDIAVPYNSDHFVVRVSEELAHTHPDLTLEFLQQAIEAISNGDKTSRFVVLDYIKPWLSNLESISQAKDNSDVQNKINDILNLLVVLSIRESNDIGPSILSKVWAVLAQCPSITDNIVQCLLNRTKSSSGISQLNEKPMDCAEDILITIATDNPVIISGKIIALFFEVLESDNSFTRLESHSSWVKIEVIIRFLLTLSFENLISIDKYLPELFYIVQVTLYCGDNLIRSNIYSLFMNIVHCLLCSSVVHPEKLPTLKFLFGEFQHLSHRIHFGVGGNKSNFSPYKADRDNKLDTMPIYAVEFVSNCLFSVMNCCYPTANCIGTEFHTRWFNLITKNAFIPNAHVQPRAISALGVISREQNLVSDDLISKLLSLLKKSINDQSVSK